MKIALVRVPFGLYYERVITNYGLNYAERLSLCPQVFKFIT